MKRILSIVIVLIVGMLTLSSCGAGYFITAEPDIVIYDDGSARNAQILQFLYYYGRYYGEPYYYRQVPPPPPRKPAPPRHEPQPKPKPQPAPPRNNNVQPPRNNPQPPRNNNSQSLRGSQQVPRSNNVHPQQPNRGGGNAPRSGANPRRVR